MCRFIPDQPGKFPLFFALFGAKNISDLPETKLNPEHLLSILS